MYTLDVETVCQVMQAHRKTGKLQADLPSGFLNVREACHVEIVLEAGKIVSCSITSSSGLLLSKEKAYQALTRLGRLRWTFVPQFSSVIPSSPTPPTPQTSEKNVISHPRRVAVVMQGQMRSWKRMHKLVYALADGTKSVAEIAEQLATPPEVIEEVLQDLQSFNVIKM